MRDVGRDLGIFVAGGKGATSRKTPAEITAACERIGRDPEPLVHASRIAAKVDSAAVQDGYQLYHHSFVFTTKGQWCIVQQGMSDATSMARRYHWLSDNVTSYVNEPHAAICCDATGETLNLVAAESAEVRSSSATLLNGAKIGRSEKVHAFHRLAEFERRAENMARTSAEGPGAQLDRGPQ